MNGRSVPSLATALLATVLALAACTSSPDQPPSTTSAGTVTSSSDAPSSAPQTPDPDPDPSDAVALRVMTFNIEYGGTGVDFGSVSKAIRAAHADVVAVNEGYGNIPRLAAALGWRFFDIRSQIVSRFPLLTPPGSDDILLRPDARTTDGRALFVEVAPGRVAAVVNVHLPSSPYGPFQVQRGATAKEVLALERRVRVTALKRPLATAKALMADDVPTFLLGDFNSPSDLDWTEATVGLRDQVRYPLRWPAPAAVEAAGMVDSYRAVHPDPVADQGLTWPASRPFVKGYNPGPAGQAADRIDLLFSGGPVETTRSLLVGERGSNPDIVVSPWPSDHRAVVSTFRITAAPTPTLVSVRSRLIERGRGLTVDYSAAQADAGSLVVKEVARPGPTPVRERLDNDSGGTERLDTTALRPGSYEVSLLDTDGEELAQMAFWVEAPGARPSLYTTKGSYRRGVPVEVSWTNAPGNRNDWLAVFREGGEPGVDSYLGWTYTDAEISATTRLGRRTRGLPWPLPRGQYMVYLLEDDGYDVLARTDFRVR